MPQDPSRRCDGGHMMSPGRRRDAKHRDRLTVSLSLLGQLPPAWTSERKNRSPAWLTAFASTTQRSAPSRIWRRQQHRHLGRTPTPKFPSIRSLPNHRPERRERRRRLRRLCHPYRLCHPFPPWDPAHPAGPEDLARQAGPALLQRPARLGPLEGQPAPAHLVRPWAQDPCCMRQVPEPHRLRVSGKSSCDAPHDFRPLAAVADSMPSTMSKLQS